MDNTLIIIAGLLALFFGGEFLVRGSVCIARNLNISKILVSSVIIGFGTSMPEMTVSISAILDGSPEIAIGNAIGSNIANILLILGISVIISPICLKNSFIKRDVFVMLIAALALCGFGLFGVINFVGGIFMLTLLVSYIAYSYLQDKKAFSSRDIKNINSDLGVTGSLSLPIAILFAFVGIFLLILGSSLFLKGAITLAQNFNISKEVIGLGIVAIGTCLPELVTAIVASVRRHGNIVIASIVGSNIFNILSIVGTISLIQSIKFPKNIVDFDLWVFLISTLIFSFMLIKNKTFSRKIGVVLLLSYVLYFYMLFNY